jgi:hypothetical protein
MSQANVSQSNPSTYTLGTADAVFLMNDELSRYLRDIGKHGVMLSIAQYAIEPLSVGSQQRAELGRKIGEEISWFNKQPDKPG